ncbi:MAG: class IV adenylate cyclase [Desulfovibrio sp.]|nr:class IV adenylate cyclase [Desulfovibrio sp.]
METERKYRDIDTGGLILRLAELGYQSQGLHFEHNLVFDTRALLLFKSGNLLRLRSQEWPGRSRHVLTFKGPAQSQAAQTRQVKQRLEIETHLEDAQAMTAILTSLGYIVVATYEKFRESLLAPDGGVRADLDRLPFGDFLEIEGEPDRIDELAQALDLDKGKISLKTYHELNQEWRTARGMAKARDFTFDPETLKRLRAACGLS